MYRKSITLRKRYTLREAKAIMGLSENTHISRQKYPELYWGKISRDDTIAAEGIFARILKMRCKKVKAWYRRKGTYRFEVCLHE